MLISFKKCVIKSIFSLNLSQRFNTFDVNKIFKSSKLVLVVGHEDGVVRTYELPSIGSRASCPKCAASFETKGGPIQSLVVHDVTKLSSSDIVISDSRGFVTVFCNEQILARKVVTDRCICSLLLDSDPTGSVGIVTVDTDGNVCSFTPYFDLWKLQLADVRRSKGLNMHGVKVASVMTATVKTSDGVSSNYVLVADETHLYIIQHGTVVLILSTPDTITAMCCGQFLNTDTSKHSPTQRHIVPSDCQIALATNTGMIYLMTNFQICDEPFANVRLPVTQLCVLRTVHKSSTDVLIAGGNFNSLIILSHGKVLTCHELPTWVSSMSVADVDQDGEDEVVVGCHDNSIHGLKISLT